LLPCNVIVYVDDASGDTIVSAVDAAQMLSIVGRDELEPIAAEVRERLGRVIAAIPDLLTFGGASRGPGNDVGP
ncbi:MAG: DUF302 domain-containing protein, partial [Thermoleophilia bacterium]|nr:DUF302 domain-containing protein [Thermoleophilia bacterium]